MIMAAAAATTVTADATENLAGNGRKLLIIVGQTTCELVERDWGGGRENGRELFDDAVATNTSFRFRFYFFWKSPFLFLCYSFYYSFIFYLYFPLSASAFAIIQRNA